MRKKKTFIQGQLLPKVRQLLDGIMDQEESRKIAREVKSKATQSSVFPMTIVVNGNKTEITDGRKTKSLVSKTLLLNRDSVCFKH